MITPFHNMALMCPHSTEADVDRHTRGLRRGRARLGGVSARAPHRRPRPPDRRPARLGHRPLQLPLPVLHARRGPAVARARRDPHVRGDRARRRGCSPRWASHDVRLTGGEPLVRRDFPRLVGDARAGPGRRRPRRSRPTATCSSATPPRSSTPGSHRFNVSIDSLAARPLLRDHPPRRAAAGAARPRGARRLPAGATRSRSTPSRCAASPRTRCSPFARVRPRAAATRCASSSSCRSTPTTPGRPTASCAGEEIRAIIETRVPARARAARAERRPRASTASPTGAGRIGFINPVSEPFCGDCNRIRLTAEGKLRTCLFSLNETDLRDAAARRRRPTTSSSRSSATPSGARSSSTT